jgi:hypothetical protein
VSRLGRGEAEQSRERQREAECKGSSAKNMPNLLDRYNSFFFLLLFTVSVVRSLADV